MRLVLDFSAHQDVDAGSDHSLERREQETIAYLIEENCLFQRQLGRRR
jgi:hypothetical protein